MSFTLIFTLLTVILLGCSSDERKSPKVKTGADVLVSEKLDLIKGKRVGLIVNHTAVLSNGKHLVDALNENNEVIVAALFGPEHGVRGDTTGAVEDAIDQKTGIPLFSLYGKTYRPSKEMLEGIDVLIYDIQDVGARFYTYISTLGHVMEAAAENEIPIIVLDRPNPIRTDYIDGPVTDDTMKSFVAYAKIPIAYGVTIGELADMYNDESWLANDLKADLTVLKMKGWKHNMWYDQTGLTWIKPSPNMPFLSTAVVYTGTCLFEGTNVSEGRGTDKPFELIGSPWIDAAKVASELNSLNISGVEFEVQKYTPTIRPGNVRPPKYNDELCNGIYLKITDRDKFEPVKTGIYLLWSIKKNHPDKFEWRINSIDRLSGTVQVRKMLDGGKSPEEIFSTWEKNLNIFKAIREKYLLYQ